MISPIEKLVREGESEIFEVKSAQADIETIARTVCGMLNQRGGIVVWGVSEPGEVTGLPEPEETRRVVDSRRHTIGEGRIPGENGAGERAVRT